MIRSITYPELSYWIREPIHTLPIPSTETKSVKKNCCTKCFSYLKFFLPFS